jgi:hypothetical protein
MHFPFFARVKFLLQTLENWPNLGFERGANQAEARENITPNNNRDRWRQ